MVNFWDLPKTIRQRIYRLHLVQEDPIDIATFDASCGGFHPFWRNNSSYRGVPRLLQVCKRTEREAAGIYFSENTFNSEQPYQVYRWSERLWPRHRRLIRRMVVCWDDPQDYGKGCNARFKHLQKYKNLELLTVKVDEQMALEAYLTRRASIKWHSSLGCSPSLQLQVLHFSGICGLRSLNIPHIELRPLIQHGQNNNDKSGAIPGGVLDTVVKREMEGSTYDQPFDRKGRFCFLDLPPEIRNAIYKLLLVFPGVTYPTTDKPTSVTYQFPYLRGIDRESIPVADSALAILQTNRQIHNEASAMFYRQNDLVFSFPAHLQAFALSLEAPRLESIANLTLFYKDHNEGGLHTMEITLRLLRRMRGLKKFHLLLEHHMAKMPWWNASQLRKVSPGSIHGVATLFSLRRIADIKIRDLDLEDRLWGVGAYTKHNPDKVGVKDLEQILKHFNHGLALAQEGSVVQELYKDPMWFYDTRWPQLGDAKCGTSIGCLCGSAEQQK